MEKSQELLSVITVLQTWTAVELEGGESSLPITEEPFQDLMIQPLKPLSAKVD